MIDCPEPPTCSLSFQSGSFGIVGHLAITTPLAPIISFANPTILPPGVATDVTFAAVNKAFVHCTRFKLVPISSLSAPDCTAASDSTYFRTTVPVK